MSGDAPAVVEATSVAAPVETIDAAAASFVEPVAVIDTGPPLETLPHIVPLRL